jgi:TRAP-type C4-dicarboxylate transport system substrate-binding protein
VLRYAVALGAIALSTSGSCLAEPTLIKFAFPAPPGSYIVGGAIEPWTKAIMAEAGDAIEIKLYPGGSIARFDNVYDRVVNGVAEIGFGTVGVAGIFPRTGVSTVPFITTDSAVASKAVWRLYAKGVTAEDFAAVRPVTLFTFSSGGMHSNRPIATAADFKGLKIGVQGKMQGDTYEIFGAAPVTMTSSDLYQSLQRGLIVGSTMSWAGVQVFKLAEVAKYHLDLPFGVTPGFFIMNKEAYAKLADKARAALDRHSGEKLSTMTAEAGIAFDERILNGLKQQPDQVFAEVAPAEQERWKTMLAPITEDWVKATPDGAKVLEAYKQEVATAVREKRR